MLLLLYHLVMTVTALVFMPVVPFLNRDRMRARLAMDLPDMITSPSPVWIHALSVGEVISAIPLVEVLRQRFPERKIAFSVTTRQGLAYAQSKLKDQVESLFPLPVDFWWSTRRVVNRIHPSIFVLVETDIWPGLLSYLKKLGVKCILINGRVSPSARTKYGFFPFLTKRLFEPFERCLMQTELDRNRLLEIGLDSEKIITSGNIKFDRSWRPMDTLERKRLLEDLKLKPENFLIVAGSTHPGEEEIILDGFNKLYRCFNELRLLIAPRRVERGWAIKRIVEKLGFTSALRTTLAENAEPYQILIVDTLGELDRFYGLARISFVGGSLVPFGGHNLLEPASFGCPVFFGPHTENFVQMAEDLEKSGGGKRVHDAEEFFTAIQPLLADPELAREMGDKAQKFVSRNRGAIGIILEEIRHLLPTS